MSLLFAAALSVSVATLPTCTWDRPGANPYVGSVVAAVDRYEDIPAPVRAALKKRMEARQYDDIAVIRRDTVIGKHRYSPEIRDMHFGPGQVCRTVTRARWTPAAEERGLVYCEAGHCIMVPTVCRNVSRVTRLPADRTAGIGTEEGSGPAGGAAPATATPEPATTAEAESDELEFEAPGAGQSFAQAAEAARPAPLVSELPGTDGGTPVEGGLDDTTGGGFGPVPVDTDTGPRGGGGGGWPFIDPPPAPGGGDGNPFPVTPPEGPVGPFRPDIGLPTDPLPAVPEPGTWALWLLGLATLAGVARRSARFSS